VIELQRSPENNSLFARAKLNGMGLTLTLDTGWSRTTLEAGVAGKLRTLKEMGMTLRDPVLGELGGDRYVLVTHLDFQNNQMWFVPVAPG
jgi:hypothetical protein